MGGVPGVAQGGCHSLVLPGGAGCHEHAHGGPSGRSRRPARASPARRGDPSGCQVESAARSPSQVGDRAHGLDEDAECPQALVAPDLVGGPPDEVHQRGHRQGQFHATHDQRRGPLARAHLTPSLVGGHDSTLRPTKTRTRRVVQADPDRSRPRQWTGQDPLGGPRGSCGGGRSGRAGAPGSGEGVRGPGVVGLGGGHGLRCWRLEAAREAATPPPPRAIRTVGAIQRPSIAIRSRRSLRAGRPGR